MIRTAVAFTCILLASASITAADSPTSPNRGKVPDHANTKVTTRAAAESIILKPQERAGLIRNTAGLTRVRLPNGAVMVDGQGRFREFVIVSTDAEGRPRIGCVHNERTLRLVLAGLAQAAPARFEEK